MKQNIARERSTGAEQDRARAIGLSATLVAPGAPVVIKKPAESPRRAESGTRIGAARPAPPPPPSPASRADVDAISFDAALLGDSQPPAKKEQWDDLDLGSEPRESLSRSRPMSSAAAGRSLSLDLAPGLKTPAAPKRNVLEDAMGRLAEEEPALELAVETRAETAQPAAGTEAETAQPGEQAEEVQEIPGEEERRIEQLGDYGAASEGGLNAVKYASRVVWRRYLLQATLRVLKSRRAGTAEHERKALQSLGEAVYERRQGAPSDKCLEAIEAVTAVKRRVEQLEASHQLERSSADEQMKSLLEEIKEAQQKITEIRARESKLLEERGKYQAIAQKHEENLRRKDQEQKELLRNAANRPDPKWLASTNNELQDIQNKVNAALNKIAEQDRLLNDVRRELVEKQAALETLHEQRRSFYAAKSVDRERQQEERKTGRRELELALTELGRSAISGGLTETAKPQAANALSAIDALQAADREIEMYGRALDAYDHEAYRRGLILLGASIALIVALWIGVNALMGWMETPRNLPSETATRTSQPQPE